MLVYECRVTERADGTIEAEPLIESGKVKAKRRVKDAPVTPPTSEQPS